MSSPFLKGMAALIAVSMLGLSIIFFVSTAEDSLPHQPVEKAGLYAATFSQTNASFMDSCTQPILKVYVVHMGTDLPQYEWTLAKKVQYTKSAITEAQKILNDGLSANGYPSISLYPVYYAIVPQGTNVSIPGVTPIFLPPGADPYGQNNIYKLEIFDGIEFASFMKNVQAPSGVNPMVSMLNRISNGAGEFELNIKASNNIPVIITDAVPVGESALKGFADTDFGTISISYPRHFDGAVGAFDLTAYERTMAHELGHALGLGHHNLPQALMTSTGAGYELDKFEAARIRATLCSPGLRPAMLAQIQPIIAGAVDACKTDTLLNRSTDLLEECNPAFSGGFFPSEYKNRQITQFCPVLEIDGTVLAQPLAINNIPSSPYYFKNVLQQYPTAVVSKCSMNCKCIPLTTGTGTPSAPNPPLPGKHPPGGGGGGGGPTTPTDRPPKPPAACSQACTPDAFCAKKDDICNTTTCACVPKDTCGNGILEGNEACEGVGNVCTSSSGKQGTCTSTCQCAVPVPPLKSLCANTCTIDSYCHDPQTVCDTTTCTCVSKNT